MPLTVDTVIAGRDPGPTQRALLLTLSDDIFSDITKAVHAQRAAASANNRRQPPSQPAIQVAFLSKAEKVTIT